MFRSFDHHPILKLAMWQHVVSIKMFKVFNDYIRQLHVSAPTGHLQAVFKRT